MGKENGESSLDGIDARHRPIKRVVEDIRDEIEPGSSLPQELPGLKRCNCLLGHLVANAVFVRRGRNQGL